MDTLILSCPTNIKDIERNENIYIAPNPIINEGKLHFYMPKSGLTTINIIDINGKIILSNSENLVTGYYSYLISGLNIGVYAIQIVSKNFSHSTTFLSQNNSNQTPTLKQLTTEVITHKNLIKLKALINIECATGDEFKFTGYSGILSDSITFIPTVTETITFNFKGLAPISNFSFDKLIPPFGGSIGALFLFSDLSTNSPTSWKWEFGDDSISTTQNTGHVYQNNGTYNVLLITSNEYGIDSITKQIIVTNLAGPDAGTVQGNIKITFGNCMPSIGDPDPSCRTIPLGTQVVITSKSNTYDSDSIIRSTYSDYYSGSYQIDLAEGEYSLFVISTTDVIWDNWSESSNGWDFTITKNQITTLDIHIDNASW
ncbi:MAG: PKD domain-containing protein [Bacteroidales bacterium]|nr:PKD domain-containing protein [Bacteroidales bacterium]